MTQVESSKNVLATRWGLPERVEFCRECVVSNQRPSTVVEYGHGRATRKPTIEFEDGVCSACRYHKEKYNSISWPNRTRELEALCDQHRASDGSYDVIVPGSGGKDSVYVAHVLKHKYGMNPLTVTWAPHRYTEIGWSNFQNWIDSGFENILVTPNTKIHSQLTQFAFTNLVHPFQPFMIGQKNVAPRIALEKKIKLIMYGESQAEGGSLLRAEDPRMPSKFFARPDSQRREIKLGGVSFDELLEQGLCEGDLNPYIPVSLEEVEQQQVEVHFMSYYLLWRPQENYYYAAEHCGFQPNPERSEGTYSKYSSLDDKIDGFHYYTTFVKFGIGRATYDAAQEIRNGHITREEGVALVRKYDGQFPVKYFEEFLNYTGLEESRFWEVIEQARSPHLWSKQEGEWVLKHQVK